MLAAGEGKRLKKYTQETPKGMLDFLGKTLIERQLEVFRANKINDLAIVRGFESNKIQYPGVQYFYNKDYATTNMVASLYEAKSFLTDDTIIAYTDIVFNHDVIAKLKDAPGDIVCVVDKNWANYWKKRYGKVDFDCESLQLNTDGSVKALGKDTLDMSLIDARIVGLYKFSKKGTELFQSLWAKYAQEYWEKPWQVSGKTFRNAYMTDLMQSFIDNGIKVSTLQIDNGWLEFDTNEDYEKAIDWYKDGSIKEFVNLR